mgnify:CR=1 FL=1
MLKKYLILILFLFFFTATSKSNDFDDLIELYDQQILGEDALYNSLKKINEEFNSDQFDKLFNIYNLLNSNVNLISRKDFENFYEILIISLLLIKNQYFTKQNLFEVYL